MKVRVTTLALALLLGACASPSADLGSSDLGIMVMAHGGSPEWNEGVLNVVEPLRDEHNVEVAFGMADAVSIQEAVSKLEARGAERIAVVRLFISGESWYERTEQILGITAGAPPRSEADEHAEHMNMPGMRMEFWRVDSAARFALSKEGLSEAEEMERVLFERAVALSEDPAREDVLILAHGPGDDAENERWLANMNARAQLLRNEIPFRRIQVATLREDWEEKREEAETLVRDFVADASQGDGRAIVIPYRVHGFGPYAEVLEGLEYIADGKGLVPHEGVTRWIERQVTELSREL